MPANTGKKTRTRNLLTHLAHEFEITLLVHENNATQENLEALLACGLEVHVAPSRVPAKRGILFPLRLAGSLFSSLPYSTVIHYQRGYRRALQALLEMENYHLVHCEWTPYARYRKAWALPWIVAAHNMEWRIWHRLADSSKGMLTRAFLRLQERRMLAFERTVFSVSPCATAVSELEAAEIQSMGCPRVAVVPNGVDTHYFAPRLNTPRQPGTLVFTGSMDWRPNQDAVVWFAEFIHPILRTAGPYRLLVVGRNPPSWMKRIGQFPPEIELTGTVDDVRPYMARSSVFVVPLRVGGGTRLKILEALAMELPVVSTSVGAEGLDLRDGVHVALADEPHHFAEAVLGLLRDQSLRSSLGKAGRDFVCDRHDWGKIAAVQASLWRDAALKETRHEG